jgi:hypothetical protein
MRVGVVKAWGMKNTYRSARQRAQLLAAFARSGLSAAAFARQHQLNYTTFCGWRQRHATTKPSPAFVEVELPAPVELWIELGPQARLSVQDASQLELVARLLQALNPARPC